MSWEVLEGDATATLPTLPDRSVHMCVTSPPYFGLRDYGDAAQIGLESTLAEYIDRLVDVFRQVRRVLRDDGTLWLNLGDSYGPGKGLLGVPWRVAFALQDDGWLLRSDIIWAKPNPMPESVLDRPTRAHEYLFLLTKGQRYFYDPDAIREDFADERQGRDGAKADSERNRGGRTDGLTKPNGIDPSANGGRNKRDVWTIATQPFTEAHFATFPPKLVEPCILAGTPPMTCGECGAPFRRLVEVKGEPTTAKIAERGRSASADAHFTPQGLNYAGSHHHNKRERETLGWEPTCDHSGHFFQPDDFDVIATPTGTASGEDPSLVVGRAGMARPRGDGEGVRLITRYEQRHYAGQLRLLGQTDPEAVAALRSECGDEAFAHYLRTDSAGARPLPADLLERLIEAGTLERAPQPERSVPDPSGRAVVLDPFSGAGTTGLVALRNDRHYIGVELNPEYAAMSRRRIEDDAPLLNSHPEPPPLVEEQPEARLFDE